MHPAAQPNSEKISGMSKTNNASVNQDQPINHGSALMKETAACAKVGLSSVKSKKSTLKS